MQRIIQLTEMRDSILSKFLMRAMRVCKAFVDIVLTLQLSPNSPCLVENMQLRGQSLPEQVELV